MNFLKMKQKGKPKGKGKGKGKGKTKKKAGYSRFDFDLKKPKLSMKTEAPTVYYSHVTDETVNLHATKLMPKTDKLNFIDPKAVEIFPKATPRLKLIVEHLGSDVPKKAIDPKIFMGIGILVVFVILGIVIFENQVVAPQAQKDRDFQLQLLQHAGNQTQVQELIDQYKKQGGGGGLFNFQPINPLAPHPVT